MSVPAPRPGASLRERRAEPRLAATPAGPAGARHRAIHFRTRRELADRPVGDAITPRGKELSGTDSVETARRLFANESVQVLPVLDGAAYVGAVNRETIAGHPLNTVVGGLVSPLLPTATAGMPTGIALAALDAIGATRLVVLDEQSRYVGIVCLRSDRERLCIDPERVRPRLDPAPAFPAPTAIRSHNGPADGGPQHTEERSHR